MMLDTGLKFHSLQGPFHSVTLRSRPQTRAFIFIPSHKIVGRYYGFMLVGYVSSRLSVHLSLCCLCPSIFLFPDHNLSECQWIFTKLGMCIDIVEIWFGIANGQISPIFNSCLPATHLIFCFGTVTSVNINGFLPNLLCALIL